MVSSDFTILFVWNLSRDSLMENLSLQFLRHLVLFIEFDSLGIRTQKLSHEMVILLHEPNLKLAQGDILYSW